MNNINTAITFETIASQFVETYSVTGFGLTCVATMDWQIFYAGIVLVL